MNRTSKMVIKHGKQCSDTWTSAKESKYRLNSCSSSTSTCPVTPPHHHGKQCSDTWTSAKESKYWSWGGASIYIYRERERERGTRFFLAFNRRWNLQQQSPGLERLGHQHPYYTLHHRSAEVPTPSLHLGSGSNGQIEVPNHISTCMLLSSYLLLYHISWLVYIIYQ